MKTVQLLYSYLLVEKPFSLETPPNAPTKEKRFAYNLYLDVIYLIDRLAYMVRGKNQSYPLKEARFVLRTENDDRINSLKTKYNLSGFVFMPVENLLAEQIKESLLFREYEKQRAEGLYNESFWENVFKNIIMPNPALNEIIKNMPDYSLSGVDRMKDLMDATFKNFYSSRENIDDALKTLEMSLQKSRDLYMRLLALPVELTKLRLDQLERNSKKFITGEEDINPNMRLADNKVARLIENNPEFDGYVEKNHLSWRAEDPELLNLLLKAILNSEIYKDYLSKDKDDIKTDSEFWQRVLQEIILNDVNFLEYLESKSVFWNDDLEIMTSFVVKTLKRLENSDTESLAVLPMYKDGEDGKDARFGAELFSYVVKNKDMYRRYIQEALQHDKWESDRLAFMDLVITMTALAEIINYPEIPLNVTINEYIEIAKSYSSAKSGQFVHGLLASLISKLKEEHLIMK